MPLATAAASEFPLGQRVGGVSRAVLRLSFSEKPAAESAGAAGSCPTPATPVVAAGSAVPSLWPATQPCKGCHGGGGDEGMRPGNGRGWGGVPLVRNTPGHQHRERGNVTELCCRNVPRVCERQGGRASPRPLLLLRCKTCSSHRGEGDLCLAPTAGATTAWKKPAPSRSATSIPVPPEETVRAAPLLAPGPGVAVPARPRTRREPPRGWAAAAARGGTAAAGPAGCAPAATSPPPRTCPRPSPGPGTGQQQEPVGKQGKKELLGSRSQGGAHSHTARTDCGFSCACATEGTSCSPVSLLQVLLHSPSSFCSQAEDRDCAQGLPCQRAVPGFPGAWPTPAWLCQWTAALPAPSAALPQGSPAAALFLALKVEILKC